MDVALDRPALYYPYIHIHDPNWLKATLLCFQQVRRMVPGGFSLKDSEEVKKFRTLKDASGEPLLYEESLETSSVHQAQGRLVTRLIQHKDLVKQRFSQAATEKEYGTEANGFQVHTGKVLKELREHLVFEELGWYPREEGADHHWLALHPRLGEALMSVIAIALAKSKGLDIVTPSSRVHHALAAQDEAEVFSDLFKLEGEPKTASVQEVADELAEVVLVHCFDLSRLSPEQIAELIKEGKDLRPFKNGLVPVAASLGDILDPEERERRLIGKAEEVIEAWRAYRESLPGFAAKAIVSAAELTLPALAIQAMSNASSTLTLAAATGLVISLATYKGLNIWREFKKDTTSPYQYLSRISEAGALLAIPSPRAAS
jgi:hypothetical protein